MRPLNLVAPVLFVAGAASLAVAFALGQATLSLVLIFPVITATGPWAALGIVLIVASFVVGFYTFSRSLAAAPIDAARIGPEATVTPPAPTRRWGGIVFLGPVPIVFGSDARVTTAMLILGLILFVGLLLFTLFLFGAL